MHRPVVGVPAALGASMSAQLLPASPTARTMRRSQPSTLARCALDIGCAAHADHVQVQDAAIAVGLDDERARDEGCRHRGVGHDQVVVGAQRHGDDRRARLTAAGRAPATRP